MPVIKAIFLKHVFHHFIFCLLLLLYRDSMTLLVEKQVDYFSAARNSTWTDFICLSKYRNSTRILDKNLVVIQNVKVENTLKIKFYLVLTIMAYRMTLRNDRMTKGIELPCRKQNHLSNISLWEQQNDINKKELFERARKRRENQIKSKSDWEYTNDRTCKENGINTVTETWRRLAMCV